MSVEPENHLEPVSETEATPEASGQAPAVAEALAGDASPAELNDGPVAAASAEEERTEAAAEEEGAPLGDLLDQYSLPHAPGEGEIIEGRVIAVTDLGVVVDIGEKMEGLVPAQEFVSAAGVSFQPGQMIEVQRLGQEKEGYELLSHLRAHRRRVWDNIEKCYRAHQPLEGKVVERIKGGLVVDVGVRAFLPASQVDLRPTHDLDEWKDQEITCAVLKMNRKRGNVVVSRRAMLEQDLAAQRTRLVDSLVEGAVVTGRVKNATDYGVFVDLGGLDGLLHVTDLAWTRVKHPSEVVTPGQEIEVKVLKFDRAKMRVSLGRKQLLPDPWERALEHYPVGTRVHGTVVGITDYGAFVELEQGIEGLVHISEMTWSRRMRHPSKIVSLGDLVEVAVLDIKPEQRRISLGLKQAMPDPWETITHKYPIGSVVTGRVRSLADFGAFVELEEGIDGLIHVTDISWTEKIKHASEKFKKGDMVQAKVLRIDTDQRRLSLGVKQLNDIWADWLGQHQLNEIVRGRVARLSPFGAFVELAEGIEGLCHISEIEDRPGRGGAEKRREAKPVATLEPGQEYDFKIVKLDPVQQRVGLSYRAALKQAERKSIEDYRSSKSSPTATIADAILAKRTSA
jgi:small subunit ribosomal protein S1